MSKDKFNINSNIEGLHIRFLPEQEQEQNISSRQFLKQAEFINMDSLLKKEDENGGSGGSQSGEQGGNLNGGSGTGGNGGSQSEPPAAPRISGKTPFSDSTTVTLSGPDGADIYYTLDGSTPTSESTMYTEEFGLSETTTVKSIAILNGVSSEVASKTFTKNA